jgi:hypothetical protein
MRRLTVKDIASVTFLSLVGVALIMAASAWAIMLLFLLAWGYLTLISASIMMVGILPVVLFGLFSIWAAISVARQARHISN